MSNFLGNNRHNLTNFGDEIYIKNVRNSYSYLLTFCLFPLSLLRECGYYRVFFYELNTGAIIV